MGKFNAAKAQWANSMQQKHNGQSVLVKDWLRDTPALHAPGLVHAEDQQAIGECESRFMEVREQRSSTICTIAVFIHPYLHHPFVAWHVKALLVMLQE